MSLLELATVKEYLQISHSVEDAVIQIMTDSCEQWVSGVCSIRFAEDLDDEITEVVDGGGLMLSPTKRPILSVTSITERGASAEASSLYAYNRMGIWRTSGERWTEGRGEWTVVYTAGYDELTLPATVKLVVLKMISRAYSNRQDKSNEGVAGWSGNWRELYSGDIQKALMAISLGDSIW